MIREAIREAVHTQTISWRSVAPHQRWAKGAFHLVSCAGMIVYRPKTEYDVSRFRDLYVSRFEQIKASPEEQEKFFTLFKEIRKNEKVKFSANLRVRCQYFL